MKASEVAKRLRISTATVWRLIKSGSIRATKVDMSRQQDHWMITEEDYQKFLKEREEI